MKQIIITILAFLFPALVRSEGTLEGTWKSSLELTKQNNSFIELEKRQVEFIEQTVGTLEITYDSKSYTMTDHDRKIFINGEEHEWHASQSTQPYKVLFKSQSTVKVLMKLPNGSWQKETINYISNNIYWVNWKENSNINLKEYFERVQ